MVQQGKAGISAWKLAWLACGICVVFLWPTWAALTDFWFGINRYSHGPLIVVVCLYMLASLRDFLQATSPRPQLLALAPLALLLFAWLVAALASVQAVQFFLLPLIQWTLFFVMLGWAISRRLIVLSAYLYLAVPIWESGNFVLQWLTVHAVGAVLATIGVPFFIEGNEIILTAGAFSVDSRCSGLHYLIVAIAISVLYATMWLRSTEKRVLLVLLAILMALVTNWVRVFAVVYSGHLTDMQHYLVTQDHYYFGWVLFAIALVPYLMFARRIERSDELVSPTPPVAQNPESSNRTVALAVSCSLVLMVASLGILYERMQSGDEQDLSLQLPASNGDWKLAGNPSNDWRPHFIGATMEAFGTYSQDRRNVDVYTNVYRGQSQGRELIGYENRIEGVGRWSRIETKQRAMNLMLKGNEWSVLEISMRSRLGEERIAYLWYDVGGELVLGTLHAKLLFGINLLRGRPDAGVTILSARCNRNCDDARDVLNDWLESYVQKTGVSG
jgi:EpsI family protein